MKIWATIVWRLFCVNVCVAGILGCSHFDVDEFAPVFPAAEDATQFSNFLAGEPVSERFEWAHGQEEFCLNVPEAGDYLLTYITGKNGSPSLMTVPTVQAHSSAIAFRATAPAYVSINVPEGELLEFFTLQRGAIRPEAVGLYDDGPIIRYASPSIPTIFWKDVFMLAPDESPITLERGVLPCPPPIASKPGWR